MYAETNIPIEFIIKTELLKSVFLPEATNLEVVDQIVSLNFHLNKF